jgi:hypothetical protein
MVKCMTATTMIILNVVLDIALLALLAFVMTRALKLTPHRAANAARSATRQRRRVPPTRVRRETALRAVLDR